MTPLPTAPGTVNATLSIASNDPAFPKAGAPFQFHQEVGPVTNGTMLAPGSYTITATVTIGKKKQTQTVAFDAATCTRPARYKLSNLRVRHRAWRGGHVGAHKSTRRRRAAGAERGEGVPRKTAQGGAPR